MEQANSRLPLRVLTGTGEKKCSLVLAGGGMRLAYQAGALKAMEEEGLKFNHADGTSGGIFNLAMLLSGLSIEQMCENWRTLNIKDFISYFPVRKYLNPFKLSAFGDADGIVQKVFPHLGIDIRKINAEDTISGTFNVCNYSLKTNEAIPHQEVSMHHLIAGVSLPIFMPAIKIKKDWYIDAVWIKDANLMEVVHRGAEEIYLIWAIGNQHEYKEGSFNQYVHMIEMSANGALFGELDYINELNGRIKQGDSPYGQQKPIRVHIIKPEYPLPLDTDLFFNKVNTTTLIEMGYADAKEFFFNPVGTSSPLSYRATKMKSPGIGFSCRLSLRGELWQKEALLHISLTIHDVDKFVQENSPYRLTASLRFMDSSATCYGFDGRLLMQENPGDSAFSGQFSFRIQMEEKDFFVLGNWSYRKRRIFTQPKIKKVKVQLYEGKSPEGEALTSSHFSLSLADWLSLRRSFSFYHTSSWYEKIKVKQKLRNHFLKTYTTDF